MSPGWGGSPRPCARGRELCEMGLVPPRTTTNLWLLLLANDHMGGHQPGPTGILKRIPCTHVRGELPPMHGAEVAEIHATSPDDFRKGRRHGQGRALIVARRRSKRRPVPAQTVSVQDQGVSPTGRRPTERPLALDILGLFFALAPVSFSMPPAPRLDHPTPILLPRLLLLGVHGWLLALRPHEERCGRCCSVARRLRSSKAGTSTGPWPIWRRIDRRVWRGTDGR